MKKIAFFSKSMHIGGMEKALLVLLNNLVNYYYIDLYLEDKSGELLNKLDNRINVKEYKLSNKKNKFFRKITNGFKRLIFAIKNYKKYDFSCNYATYSIIGSRLANISSHNSCFYVHSDYYNVYKGNKNKIKEFFEVHKLEKFKTILFVSNESEQNFLRIYPNLQNKTQVINNLINYSEIMKKSKEKIDIKLKKENTNCIFVGRLDNESKNLDLLLSVYKELNNTNNYLYIVGSGPYLKNIKNFIKKYELKNISILGSKENQYPYINAADSMILTSNYEGYPVIYSEALVLNKKVITTIDVSDECIKASDYFKIVKKDKEDIIQAIKNIKKKKYKYNIDFEEINERRINYLKKIIDEKNL